MRPHLHHCANRQRGCLVTWECRSGWVFNDGFPDRVCAAQPADDIECEECMDATSCEWCGALEHLQEPHAEECPVYAQYVNPMEAA